MKIHLILAVFLISILLLTLSCGDDATDDGNGTGTGTGTGDELSITVTNPPAEGAFADSYFTIKWTYTRKSVTFPKVSLYYDSDTHSGGEIAIAENIPASAESLVWKTYDMPEDNYYYILAVIDDSETCSVSRKPFNEKSVHTYYTRKNHDSSKSMEKAQDYSDGTVRIDHCSFGCRQEFYHGGEVNSVVFSPDEKHVLSGGSDNAIRYFRISDGECLKTMKKHGSAVTSDCISSDGLYALSGSWDNKVFYWRLY